MRRRYPPLTRFRLDSKGPPLDFMGRRHAASVLSLVLVVLSVVALAWRGLALGIEFTGGALFELHFPATVALEPLRVTLQGSGLDGASVQFAGGEQDVVVRLPVPGQADVGELAGRLEAALAAFMPGSAVVSSALVGPAVGGELRDAAGLGALASLAAVGLYVMLRFAGIFAVGATVALVHDVAVTLGFFAVTGLTFDLPAFAAVLAIVGYSLNDTIVVYDRVRENLRRMRVASPAEAINRSLNQTLERTLAMSGTTLFTVLALLVFGGDSLRSFSSALTVGVVVGTYSSIYVASSLLLTLGVTRRSVAAPEQEPGDGEP